jgi:hypothetical protein
VIVRVDDAAGLREGERRGQGSGQQLTSCHGWGGSEVIASHFRSRGKLVGEPDANVVVISVEAESGSPPDRAIDSNRKPLPVRWDALWTGKGAMAHVSGNPGKGFRSE